MGKGAVAFLAVAHPGVEASSANGQVHKLGHGDHHPQVVLRQLHPVHALQVEDSHSLALIEEWRADLGGHMLLGPKGVSVGAHVFHEQRPPGADGSRADAFRQGDLSERLVVPDLVLEHQFPAFEQVGAQPGVVVGLGYDLHRPGEYASHLQLTRYCRANPVEEGQFPRPTAEPLLGPSALRDVTHGDCHALDRRVPSRSTTFVISEECSTTERKQHLVCPGLSSPPGSRFGSLFGANSGSSTTAVFPADDDDWTRSIPEVDATRPSIPPGLGTRSRGPEPCGEGLTMF